MTTPARKELYLAEHKVEMEGKGWAVYNPQGKPFSELPIIYGFNNGGSHGWYSAVLIAEDGTCLGGHLCSSEGYMPHDLGILEGTRPDRHKEQFQEHYPNGYRMEFVESSEIYSHAKLNEAFKLNKEAAQDKPVNGTQQTQAQLGQPEQIDNGSPVALDANGPQE